MTRYPLLFRGHVHGFRCTRHVSLQRSVETVPYPQGPSVKFPRLNITMERSDSLPLISPHFVSFAWRYHRSSPVRPHQLGTELWINLELVSRDSKPAVTTETSGSLRFPSDPRVPAPCSWTPVGPKYARPLRASARPPLVSTTVAPASRRFRGSIARHWDSLSTLRNGGRPPPRKTRFRLLAKLCRAGFVNPQGCNERFPSSISSPFLELT